MSRVDQYPALTAPPPGFQLFGNDVTDFTQGSHGSGKSITPQAMVQTLWPSGVTSGLTDAAAIAAAYTSGATYVKLAPSAPWYIAGGQVTVNASNRYLDGEGCFINHTGSGDMLRWLDSSTYGARTVHGGGVLGNPVVDGSAMTGAGAALHIGDIFRCSAEISPQNYTVSGSDGVIFDNQYYWTEKIRAKINASNCTRGVRFTQNPAVPGTPTSTGSFMRSFLDIYVNQGSPSYDGIVWEKGTYCPGSILDWKGNFGGSNTGSALTSAAVRVTGSSPSGSADSGTFSSIQVGAMFADFECSAFTFTPFQYVVDTSCTIANMTGSVNFSTAGNNFRAGTGFFGFSGVSDTLPTQVFSPQLFQGVIATGTYASATVLASSGTISSSASYIQVTPAANVTGVIAAAGSYDGQILTVNNTSTHTITFAAAGTSNVADGVSDVIASLTARQLTWSTNTNLWYRVA